MMKWYYIFGLLLLLACDDESGRDAYYLSGYYRADTKTAAVEYFQMSEDGIIIHDQDASIYFLLDSDNIPFINSQQNTYTLNVEDLNVDLEKANIEVNAGINLFASADVPPSLDLTAIGNTIVSVDPGQPGEEVFDLSWNEIPGHSFLARLECMEQNPVEIPFASGGGFFDVTFERPFVETGMLIYASDFKFYGAHKLTVFVLDDRYADLFFLRNGSLGFLTVEGPDNIENGKGFWTAVSAYEVDLVVQ